MHLDKKLVKRAIKIMDMALFVVYVEALLAIVFVGILVARAYHLLGCSR